MRTDAPTPYPAEPDALRDLIDGLLAGAPEAPDLDGVLVGLVVPDADRVAGGPAAAAAYRLLQDAEVQTVVVVSPSHHGATGRLSIRQSDAYPTPLGDVRINDDLRNELCDEDDDIYLDDWPAGHTEGADVQIPFLLRALGPDLDVVPIVMGDEGPAYCRELGGAVGEVMYGKRAVVVGTCDLVGADADGLDRLRAAVEALDVGETMHLLNSDAVRVEGHGALATALIASKERGAKVARVLALDPPAPDAPGALAVAFWR